MLSKIFRTLMKFLGYTKSPRAPALKKIRVIDGDTIELIFYDGDTRKIRLAGFDAPEIDTKEGEVAKEVLKRFLTYGNDRILRYHKTQAGRYQKDKYGRYIGDIIIDGTNARAMLKRLGLTTGRFERKDVI